MFSDTRATLAAACIEPVRRYAARNRGCHARCGPFRFAAEEAAPPRPNYGFRTRGCSSPFARSSSIPRLHNHPRRCASRIKAADSARRRSTWDADAPRSDATSLRSSLAAAIIGSPSTALRTLPVLAIAACLPECSCDPVPSPPSPSLDAASRRLTYETLVESSLDYEALTTRSLSSD